jgi:hypothetical protein
MLHSPPIEITTDIRAGNTGAAHPAASLCWGDNQ